MRIAASQNPFLYLFYENVFSSRDRDETVSVLFPGCDWILMLRIWILLSFTSSRLSYFSRWVFALEVQMLVCLSVCLCVSHLLQLYWTSEGFLKNFWRTFDFRLQNLLSRSPQVFCYIYAESSFAFSLIVWCRDVAVNSVWIILSDVIDCEVFR